MALNQLASELLRQDIFKGLTPLQLTEIVRRAEKVILRKDEILVEKGEIGDAAILIVGGELRRVPEPGSEDTSEPIEAGYLVGELAMLIEFEHAVTIRALTEVKAMRITRDSIHQQMHDDPRLAQHFTKVIASRLSGMAEALRRIAATLDGEPSELPKNSEETAA